MEPGKIAIIPDAGYNRNQKTSKSAEAWLKFMMFYNNINIKHQKNGGEKSFENYRVDGWDDENKTIYE